ncbi:hypothetical protein [Luteococcus sp. OSA5]|uniref:hypothetical protein n=1 Tax=Luteococcus sp. OSA5 TaxID=3401630 RepID=UPI003B429F8C
MGAVGVLTGVAVITVVPVLLLLQLVAMVPVLLRGARVSPAAAGRRTTACSLSYWGCVLLLGVSMGDLRDTSRPAVSAPLVSLGIPVELANLVAILAAVGGAISLIVLVVVAWIELCRLPPTVQGPPFPTGKDGP